jgi:copper chaperone
MKRKWDTGWIADRLTFAYHLTDFKAILDKETMEKAVLRVDGMSCDHCVKTITKAVGDLPGMKNVAVDVKDGTVSFIFDPAK